MVALGKGPSTNAPLTTAVSLCRVLTWLSAKPLPRACHVALGKDSLCRLRLCRAVFAERALGKGFAESIVALCRALGLSAKYQNPVVSVEKKTHIKIYEIKNHRKIVKSSVKKYQ